MEEESGKYVMVRKAKKKILTKEGSMRDAWVYQQVNTEVLSFTELVKECLESNGMSKSQTVGIAYALSDRIGHYLGIGRAVRLDGVGTFKPVINSESAPTKEELPPIDEAVTVKMRFYPHPPLQKAVKESGVVYKKELDD